MEIIHSLYLFEIPRFGGWNFFTYIFYLFIGYIFAYDQKFKIALKKNIVVALISGVLSTISLILMNIYNFNDIWLTVDFTTVKIPFLLARVIFTWSWLIVILYLGDKYLNRESKIVKNLNEMVLPFYIVHFVVLAIVGFFIVQSNLMAISKFFIIFGISLVAIVLLLLLIREFNVFRFIFGMSITKKKSLSRFFKKKDSVDEQIKE
jgi:surface polysaccharide O-acyltransferase-like enzyme